MATHKPFRELVKPNSNFEFIEKRRTWGTVSFLLIIASIATLFVNNAYRGDILNWTIDFKGGTEIVLEFRNADAANEPADVGAGEVRKALKEAGKTGFAVSDFSWNDEADDGTVYTATGMLVRTPEFGAVPAEQAEKVAAAFVEVFGERKVEKASWSGDQLIVRTGAPISWEEGRAFFAEQGLTLKPWDEDLTAEYATPVDGAEEYRTHFSVEGIGAQYKQILGDALGSGVEVSVQNAYGVGAKAGARLRNDGIKALFYAMALIMLYLAFRFDIRYAPGAVVALLHDAILVIGVFAVTWQEVSLTTVAALLTVIGYSVNDSVVIFDRIRENVGRLKDKKFGRVINISLNETMSRTLLTSITLFVVTLMMNIFGSGLVRNFAFAMNVGVVVGVYSSVFVASPVALTIHNRYFSGKGKAKPKKS